MSKSRVHRYLEIGSLIAAIIGCVTGTLALSWNIWNHYSSHVERALASYSLKPTSIQDGLPFYEIRLHLTNLGTQDLYVKEVILEHGGTLTHLREMEEPLKAGSYRTFAFNPDNYVRLLLHWHNYDDDFYEEDADPKIYVVTSRGNRFPARPQGHAYLLARLKTLSWVGEESREKFLQTEKEFVEPFLKRLRQSSGKDSENDTGTGSNGEKG